MISLTVLTVLANCSARDAQPAANPSQVNPSYQILSSKKSYNSNSSYQTLSKLKPVGVKKYFYELSHLDIVMNIY